MGYSRHVFLSSDCGERVILSIRGYSELPLWGPILAPAVLVWKMGLPWQLPYVFWRYSKENSSNSCTSSISLTWSFECLMFGHLLRHFFYSPHAYHLVTKLQKTLVENSPKLSGFWTGPSSVLVHVSVVFHLRFLAWSGPGATGLISSPPPVGLNPLQFRWRGFVLLKISLCEKAKHIALLYSCHLERSFIPLQLIEFGV